MSIYLTKSKFWEPDETFTYARSDFIYSDWQEYLYDVAVQAWVIRKALPGYQAEFYLMLIDKTKKATFDGLHQFFMREEKFSTIYPALVHIFMMTLRFVVMISISEYGN